MSTLQACIEKYGPEAGPKLHRALKSRAAYKGVSTRRRRKIETLTGQPYRVRRRASTPASRTLIPEVVASGDDTLRPDHGHARAGEESAQGALIDACYRSLDVPSWNLEPIRN